MEKEIISKEKLADELKKFGIQEGDMLNLKISLKSIGYVKGGAKTVIDALLEVVGPTGTIVTESFVDAKYFFQLIFSKKPVDINTKSYAGAISNSMFEYEDCYISTHPIHRFGAIGYYAKQLTSKHNPSSSAYGLLEEMCYLGGKNLRIGGIDKVVGVGTTHVAIVNSGLQQKRIKFGVYYRNSKGKKVKFVGNWAGGCATGFNRLLNDYRKNDCFIKEGLICNAPSILSDMQKTLNFELNRIKEDNGFFFCNDPTCINCQLTWKFSQGDFYKTLLENFKRRNYKNIFKAISILLFSTYLPEDKHD